MEANKDIDERRLQRAVVTNALLESGRGGTEVQGEVKSAQFQSFAANKGRSSRADFKRGSRLEYQFKTFFKIQMIQTVGG